MGDDVYGEDPTVRRLEEEVAGILGFEAALFVSSGTMGNNLAVKVWTRAGDEVLCEERGHSLDWELAGVAALCGVLVRPVRHLRGRVTPDHIARLARPSFYARSSVTLAITENTHNMAGGLVTTPADMAATIEAAHAAGMKLHVDGARLWNAAVALSCTEADLVRGADSVMVCLSKSLGAPVGSLFVAPRAAVEEARRWRKQWGGGMRQVGVLAAAGLVAVARRSRLAEDHEKARAIVKELSGVTVRVIEPETNIVVIADIGFGSARVMQTMSERGFRISTIDTTTVRLVTHQDVSHQECVAAGRALAEVIALG